MKSAVLAFDFWLVMKHSSSFVRFSGGKESRKVAEGRRD